MKLKRRPFEAKDEFEERKKRIVTPDGKEIKSNYKGRRPSPVKRGIAGVNPPDRERLTPLEVRFVLEYVKDYVAKAAAERIGRNSQYGYVLLKKPAVIDAIDHYEKNLATRFVYDKNKVLKELSLLANSDIRDYIDIRDGRTYLKDMSELSPQVSRAIKKVRGFRKIKAIRDNKGNYTGEDVIDETIEIELYDKTQALQLMGKELHMFTERKELTGANGTPLLPTSLILDFGEEKTE